MEIKYALVHKDHNMIGRPLLDKADVPEAVANSNIPQDKIKVYKFPMERLNKAYAALREKK